MKRKKQKLNLQLVSKEEVALYNMASSKPRKHSSYLNKFKELNK